MLALSISEVVATEVSRAAVICVDLDSTVERPLTIIATPTQDGNATGLLSNKRLFEILLLTIAGGGVDFVSDEISIVIMPPNTTECGGVSIIDDSIRESSETFSVLISSPDEPVTLRDSTALVIILDNDGKTP